MPSEKDVAIILRVIPFSETSSIVTLFTEKMGKISAIAKGARRPKSPFESALDVLAVCRIVFIHKQSQTLDLLTEAKLEHRFRAAARDLTRLYAAFYLAELLLELTTEGDPHPRLFTLAMKTLRSLDNTGIVGREILRFELVALHLLGHLPSLDKCVECGRGFKVDGSRAFSELEGGVLCENCKSGKHKIVRISSEACSVLRHFSDSRNTDWKEFRIRDAVFGEIRGLVGHYISHIIGRRPRMHDYLPIAIS